MERGMKKIKFGQEVFYGPTPDDVPYVQLSPLDEDIIVSYTGPDNGLIYAESSMETIDGNPGPVAGCKTWNRKEPQAYGICISLYEQHPISMKMSGEPIADSFAICARKNNTILLIADGVNWGEKSRLAARCALYGSMKFLNYKIFDKHQHPATTQDLMLLLRKSVDEAHRSILARDGGLTTMCACMVCPVDNSDQHAVCCVNVGDSYGYVYSHNQGIREVTVGSHDVLSERDIRDAGGAIGPVDGQSPELHNLTCSVTFCNRGDIVFLSTDGVSDNFDPVVTKIALPQKADDSNFNKNSLNNPNGSMVIDKPEMSPKERHVYSMKEMERVIHEYELLTEETCSAQEFCSAMVQHVLTMTDGKRKILENPALYAKRKMTSTDRKRRDTDIVEKMSKAPGKLDHASIVAVELCGFMGKEEEEGGDGGGDKAGVETLDNSAAVISDDNTGRETLSGLASPTSPTSPSVTPKKSSGARKFLSKLKNLPSPTSSTSSPATSPQAPHHHSHLSPKSPGHRSQSPLALHLSPRKFHKRGGRQRFNSEPETPASPTVPESPFESERSVVSPSVAVRGAVVSSRHRHHGGRGGVVSCGNEEDVASCGSRVASLDHCVASPDCRRLDSPVGNVASSGGNVTSRSGNVASRSGNVASRSGNVASSSGCRVVPPSSHGASSSGQGISPSGRNVAFSSGRNVASSSGRNVASSSGRNVASSSSRKFASTGLNGSSPGQEIPSSGRIVPSPSHRLAASGFNGAPSGRDADISGHGHASAGGLEAACSGRVVSSPSSGGVTSSGHSLVCPCCHVVAAADSHDGHRGSVGEDVDVVMRNGRKASPDGSGTPASLLGPSDGSVPVAVDDASPLFVDPSSPSQGPLRLSSRSRRSQVVSQCIAVESSL